MNDLHGPFITNEQAFRGDDLSEEYLIHIAEIEEVDNYDAVETGCICRTLTNTHEHGHAHQKKSYDGLIEGKTLGDHHEGQGGADGVVDDVGEAGNEATSATKYAYLGESSHGFRVCMEDWRFTG